MVRLQLRQHRSGLQRWHTDTVEAVLEGSRTDLKALRDRALSMFKLYVRLRHIIQSSDPRYLQSEIERMDKGAAAYETRRNLRRARGRKREHRGYSRPVANRGGQAEANHRRVDHEREQSAEFKLAMELKKADAAMGAETAGAPNVTELQSRLQAATDACDELVGARGRRRRRARRSA